MRRRHKTLLLLLGMFLVVAGVLAWRFYTWGRPLPKAYQRLEMTPAGPEGGRSTTYLRQDNTSSSGRRFVTLDNDADGTVDIVLGEGQLESFARPRADDPQARWLVVCLDGVPYSEMAALWEEGYFRELFRPVPLIPPFPTASGVALTASFHTAPVEGYEDGYFDLERNRLAGGALMTTTGENIPYLEALDYELPGYLKGLAYLLPQRSFRADLGRLRSRFRASREKIFLAHVASSDSLYHILSRQEMRRLLTEVDSLLRELYLDARGKLRITLFSDHGNSLAAGHPVPLEKHLAAGGWQLSERCGTPRHLVVPAYGLLGFFAVYCVGQDKPALANHLARMEGVDLVVYTDSGGVVMENAGGAARLEGKNDGSAFRYQPLSGDPLALTDLLETLKENGSMDAEGWVPDAMLFEATRNHRYPDPAYRLWQWTRDYVRNRAELVVSLKPGYHQGTNTFEWFVDMTSTHGSLDLAQSLGFATSTDAPLPGPIRSRDLLPATILKWEANNNAPSPRR